VVRPLARILFVEDEADIRTIARMALEEVGGFEVLACASGPEAIAAAPTARADLLLLDAMMPGMDGLATLAALRTIPATRSTPVIFITARLLAQQISSYQALGAAGIIAKPFSPMDVSGEILRIWEKLRPAPVDALPTGRGSGDAA